MVGAALLVAAPSWAIQVTVDRLAGYSGGDGEFNVTPIVGVGYAASTLVNNSLGQLGFETFCLERAQDVGPFPGVYDAVVNPIYVVPGAPGTALSPLVAGQGDPISIGTAFLYSQFAAGTLANYNYTPGAGRQASAYLLQLAFWVLEGDYDINSIVPGSNPFINAVVGQFVSLAGAAQDANQAYSVGVLNLTQTVVDQAGGRTIVQKQDMLVMLPDGGASLLLLGMGLMGLVGFRRNRA